MTTSQPKFQECFGAYVCPGDSIRCIIDNVLYVATIHHDDTGDWPGKRDEGFWPSLDPKSAGYIGPKSKSTLRRHMARAREIMRAWEADEWFYCGIVISASLLDSNGEEIEFCPNANSLWGVECNYPAPPKSFNAHLNTIANELLPNAIHHAKHLTALSTTPAMQHIKTLNTKRL